MPGETTTDRRSALHDRTDEMHPGGIAASRDQAIAPRRLRHDDPLNNPPEPSYYDVPMLKAPLWKWEIASYFFFGGLSSGAYLISRMADRFGRGRYRSLTRAGAAVSFAALVPCAPLLIHDLGDAKRFHHMLRLLKWNSPMSVGSWTLTGYSGAAALNLLDAWAQRPALSQRGANDEASTLGKMAELVRKAETPLVAVTDAAGIPLALMMASYTGVLLSCTATPMWSRNGWISPLFTASAVSAGAAGISLALSATGDPPHSAAHRALEQVDTAAHAAEIATLAGYLKTAGPLARPLTRGTMRHHLWAAVGGIVFSEVLKLLPLRGRKKRTANVLSALVGLAGGFSLRWAFVYGGHDSANNPRDNRLASRGGWQAESTGTSPTST